MYWWLYASRAISTTYNRLFEFAVPVMFATIWENTFVYAAIFDFFVYVLCAITMPKIADLVVAKYDRLNVMYVVIASRNVAMICTVLLLYFVSVSWSAVRVACYVCLLVSGTIADISSRANTIAIEKDWIPTLLLSSDDDDKESSRNKSSKMNATIRRIDLCGKLVAPFLFGLVFDAFHSPESKIRVGLLFVIGYVVFASIPEIYTLRQVYKKSPVLYSKIQCLLDDDTSMIDKTPSFTQAWRTYFKQNLLFASIACGMLYANILSSGSIMTQYLVSNEIPLSQIGGFHGLGALFGIFGTLIWPRFRNLSKSLSRAGECSIVTFAIMMCLCGLVFVLNIDSTTRVYVMMISVAVSRLPVWTFDLMITQLLQDHVHSSVRGVVSGCHVSVFTVFNITIYALTIVFHKANEFSNLVYISVSFVVAAAILFVTWRAFLLKEKESCDTDDSDESKETTASYISLLERS